MASSSTRADYKQETRFAVVMYGGVSLAIYINGITQELFHLVSATAREKAGSENVVPFDELTPTQRVYRKLSYILANRGFRDMCKNQAEAAANQKKAFQVPNAPPDDTIETRFVIDILSGTSAGGINAIFLAKALANNQNIDQLKELWVNEGDIGLLLNDKRSVGGLGLKNQKPPLSLLNSRRLYLKLLKAFDDMKKANADEDSESRFLDESELDLFITTTDISGMALPIRLSDSVVFERRHRNVFQFRYASKEATDEERNDFVAENNPFLAFAARSTSSFPFAFEPMKLSDIDEVLETFPDYRAKMELRGSSSEWLRFFNPNLLRAVNYNIADRSFGDGGYLDNKPFSYAAETISRRQAPLPVDRKLIYIEPSPEHPENDGLGPNRIDALRNVKAALLDLPAYETIREDLQRLMERNSLIARVNHITDAIERDLDDSRVERPSLEPNEWKELDLAGMVQRFGIYYIPYRRLRIEAASDELARTVVRMLGLDEDSAEYIAVRALIHAWREKTYVDKNTRAKDDRLHTLAEQLSNLSSSSATPEHLEKIKGQLRNWLQLNLSDAYSHSVASITEAQPEKKAAEEQSEEKPPAEMKTANQFLLDYDFKYWLRRLSFVRSRIDQLLQLHKIPGGKGKLEANDKQKAIISRLNKYLGDRPYDQLSEDEKSELETQLTKLRSEVISLHKTFRMAGRNIQSPKRTEAGSNERKFADSLKKIKLSPELLNYLLGTADKEGKATFSKLKAEDSAHKARLVLDDPNLAEKFGAQALSTDLQAAADALCEALKSVLEDAWNKCTELLETPNPNNTPQAEGVRKYLWQYLNKFDDYDQIRFPIMYGTDGTESDVVEIFRISPEDAPSLIDERAESQKPNGRMKLAGTSLHHFGAFLDRVWRQNDIMWGRLDGAERLITMLLPYPDRKDALVRQALIKEAQAAILREELSTESRSQLSTIMSEALIRASTGEPIEAAVEKVMKHLEDASPVKTRLASAITAIFDDDPMKKDDDKDDKLVTFVKLGYQVNRNLDPKAVLETISRSTQTIGGIFEDLASQNDVDSKSLSWIARLGQFFWGLVQVAVPNSLKNRLATHWIYTLYAFELVIIVGGFVLGSTGAHQFGWTALGITAFINVLTLVLRDKMRGRGSVKRTTTFFVVLLIAGLTLIGLLKLVGVLGLRLGDSGLPPLAWISSGLSVLPLQGYWPFLVPLLVVIAVLVILNLSGHFNFARSRPKPEGFKSIELLKFKERDMKDIYLKEVSGVNSFNVTGRLSARPPTEWIRTFEEQWKQQHPETEVRVFADQVRFESDAQGVARIWSEVRSIVGSTNQAYSRVIERQNQALEDRLQREKDKLKREQDAKWATFKKLT